MKDDALFRIDHEDAEDNLLIGALIMKGALVSVETKREWRCTHPNVFDDDYEGDCGDWPLWRKDKAHAACGWRTYVKEDT
jgi:hypothetical protein